MFEGDDSSVEDWAMPGADRPRVPLPLPAAVLAVQTAVEGLRGWQPCALAGEQTLAATRVILAAEQVLQAAKIRALTDIEHRKLHRLEDARSTLAWLREQGAEVPPAQLGLARRLSGLPLVADELAAGRMSVAVAQHVQAALATLRPHVDRADGRIDGQPAGEALSGVILDGARQVVVQARGGFAADDPPELAELADRLADVHSAPVSELARLEAAFVLVASHVETGQLAGALGQLVDALLPAQLEERARRAEQARRLKLVQKHDGTGWRLEGDLSFECGERLHTVLQSELTRDPDSPLDTEAAAALRSEGLDPYDPDSELASCGRPRSRGERLHDALHHALERYLAAGMGGTHDKNPVQILVTLSAGTLDREPGTLPARGAAGVNLPVSLVRRWACAGAATRLVMSLAGRVLEMSHSERTLKGPERRALYAQTGGVCQASGCVRSTRDTGAIMHAHHGTPWARCGSTSLDDTVLLCDASHADIHEGGRVIRLKDGRRLGPDGWVT